MSSGVLFGTDGIRDEFGKGHLAKDQIRRILQATAATLEARQSFPRDFPTDLALSPEDDAGCVVVGRDTRDSGVEIVGVVVDTLTSHGFQVLDAGVIPSPGVAHVARHRPGVVLGIMVSASHNPAKYNGIKFFAPTGAKISPEFEVEVSRRFWPGEAPARRQGGGLESDASSIEDYTKYLVEACDNPQALRGVPVVLDAANGATSVVAPRVFSALGARVVTIADTPDGFNINESCGALHPQVLAQRVQDEEARLGFCFDGDGDRMIPVTEKGRVLDGDFTLAISARELLARGRLPAKTVVATVMSNIGLEKSLMECGVQLLRTPVGDRHVYEAMIHANHPLGGEQSGHLIFLDDALTGDGILAALRLVDSLESQGGDLEAAASVMRRYPQALINYEVAQKLPLEQMPDAQQAVVHAEEKLEGEGRIVLRYSGTEPLVRVMVEGPSEELVTTLARELGETVVSVIKDHSS